MRICYHERQRCDTGEIMIDIGVNLASGRFAKDRDEVLDSAWTQGVEAMIITGTSVAGSAEVAELSACDPTRLFATAGVHPHDAKTWGDASTLALRDLLRQPQVVAVGECGLDFNRDFSPRPDQIACFEAQLALAAEVGKPVFLHQRDAHAAFMPILSRYRDRLPGAVVHCFTGTGEELEEYLSLDCHIGVTGWICDKKRGGELRELVGRIPAERLMVETDAPYLTPQNLPEKPKGNRNEPAFLKYVIEKIAECRGESFEAVAQATTRSARAFFQLP